jgi:hypothetical protein
MIALEKLVARAANSAMERYSDGRRGKRGCSSEDDVDGMVGKSEGKR